MKKSLAIMFVVLGIVGLAATVYFLVTEEDVDAHPDYTGKHVRYPTNH